MDLGRYNFAPQDERDFVCRELEKAYEVFAREAMPSGEPVMCRIHDAFETIDTSHHNCLGCNFANSIHLIDSFLQTYSHQGMIQYAFTNYLLLQYLLTERIDTLFNLIQLNPKYRIDRFKVLMEIRRWANFIKHPKAFLLTHHPEYTSFGSPKNKELLEHATIVIDRKFVDNYYSNDEKNTELFNKLENKEDVLVVYPNVVQLTEGMCQAMHDCIAVIRDNPVYREVLASRTTFLNYWPDRPEPVPTSSHESTGTA